MVSWLGDAGTGSGAGGCDPSRGERAPDGAPEFADQQLLDQPSVGELGVGEREPDAEQGVIADPAGLRDRCAGGVQGIPGSPRAVRGLVLDRVQKVRDPAEEPTRLGQRLLVPRPSGQHRRITERRSRGPFGRLGDSEQARASAGGRFHGGLGLISAIAKINSK